MATFGCLLLLASSLWSQADSLSNTVEKPKTGWNVGFLPAVSYNSDMGFQYGGVVNFFHFGDGSRYPRYDHSLYLEVSRFTKGSGINRFSYDSDQLLPGLRTTADLSWLTEKALDFYGFNGYDASYKPDWENEDSADYVSRAFYRHDRQIWRFTFDLQGGLFVEKLRWLAGLGVIRVQVAAVDRAALDDQLPEVPGLYEHYVDWGVIPHRDRSGGWANHLRLGVVYDSRDVEPNPTRGLWSECLLFAAPDLYGNDPGYAKISLIHRQYFPLLPERLTLAARIHFQTTVAGRTPFYMQPYMIQSFYNAANADGLGGARTLRGVLRNRVVGDGVLLANAELRWRSNSKRIWNQNFYLGINAFADTGRVTRKIPLDTSAVPEDVYGDFFSPDSERFHTTLGGGLRVVMNSNFILAFDCGKPLDSRDGGLGLYVGLNYLF